jgi:hypothetical protein
MLKHALLLIQAETCCALDIYLHMKIHIQLSTCANTCKHTLNCPYKPTKADKFAALDKSQKCKLMLISSIQASKMQIHAPLCVCADTSHCMHSAIHPQPLMLADTSRYMT